MGRKPHKKDIHVNEHDFKYSSDDAAYYFERICSVVCGAFQAKREQVGKVPEEHVDEKFGRMSKSTLGQTSPLPPRHFLLHDDRNQVG